MRRLRSWCVRLWSLFGKDRRDREFAEELESHLRDEIDQQSKSGRSEAEAFEAAARTSGQAGVVEGEFKKLGDGMEALPRARGARLGEVGQQRGVGDFGWCDRHQSFNSKSHGLRGERVGDLPRQCPGLAGRDGLRLGLCADETRLARSVLEQGEFAAGVAQPGPS